MNTIDTWPRWVKNFDELPQSFMESFRNTTLGVDAFPCTVFAPPDTWNRRRTTPKVISVTDNHLLISEKNKKTINNRAIPFNEIICIETGTVLLKSWIKIGCIHENQVFWESIIYNTVAKRIFENITQKIKEKLLGVMPGPCQQEEKVKFNWLIKPNYKFMNFGKQSIQNGESVIRMLLQQEISEKFYRYFTKTLTSAHLTILTDKELVIINEGESKNPRQQSRYGGTWHYLPLAQLTKLSISEDLESNLIKFTAHLSGETEVTNLFGSEKRDELMQLLTEFEKIK